MMVLECPFCDGTRMPFFYPIHMLALLMLQIKNYYKMWKKIANTFPPMCKEYFSKIIGGMCKEYFSKIILLGGSTRQCNQYMIQQQSNKTVRNQIILQLRRRKHTDENKYFKVKSLFVARITIEILTLS